ncbi:MAG: TonB-dependent receptor plug domain-containing protein [Gemmatimonadota bacterium]|nr:TonB-dependent receptor plug domain-containing protein [Gemmatimonadota bacterium]
MKDLRLWKRPASRGAAPLSLSAGCAPGPVRLRGAAIPLLGAALFLVAAPSLSAQVGATLRGVVRSGITGEVIAGAVVQIVGTRAMTTTDDDGRYAILTVPMGESVVRVTHSDHVGLVDRLHVDRAEVIRHDFEMMPPAYVLEEVVARAMRRVEIPDNAIDGSELEHGRGVREVLAGVTGVTLFRTSGAVGAGYYLRIRGAKSFHFNQHPVVFVDGVRVRALGTAGGLGALELIDPGTIARIEVLKGPAADAKYGPDAADGVVLITTRRGGGP